MIQAIGLLIAAYCATRLLQVPIEHTEMEGKARTLWVLSVLGLLGVGVMTLAILVSPTPR